MVDLESLPAGQADSYRYVIREAGVTLADALALRTSLMKEWRHLTLHKVERSIVHRTWLEGLVAVLEHDQTDRIESF